METSSPFGNLWDSNGTWSIPSGWPASVAFLMSHRDLEIMDRYWRPFGSFMKRQTLPSWRSDYVMRQHTPQPLPFSRPSWFTRPLHFSSLYLFLSLSSPPFRSSFCQLCGSSDQQMYGACRFFSRFAAHTGNRSPGFRWKPKHISVHNILITKNASLIKGG